MKRGLRVAMKITVEGSRTEGEEDRIKCG